MEVLLLGDVVLCWMMLGEEFMVLLKFKGCWLLSIMLLCLEKERLFRKLFLRRLLVGMGVFRGEKEVFGLFRLVFVDGDFLMNLLDCS